MALFKSREWPTRLNTREDSEVLSAERDKMIRVGGVSDNKNIRRCSGSSQ